MSPTTCPACSFVYCECSPSLDTMHAESTAAISAEDSATEHVRAYMRNGSPVDALAAIIGALEAHAHRVTLGALLK